VFSLCLLAQAYEHASNLLYIFADLEITVQMLVQIDKLVQLIESPVFTYLRLQLLEPERYPHLFKCLYGLLMLLPQSLAFVSLRNRLNAVNSAGFLYIAPKSPPSTVTTRSKMGREDIRWQDLLLHFRSIQAKHEKARRQAMGADNSQYASPSYSENEGLATDSMNRGSGPIMRPPPVRRRVTGEINPANANGARTTVLSPLNPRARAGGLASVLTQAVGGRARPMSPPLVPKGPIQKRAGTLDRKV